MADNVSPRPVAFVPPTPAHVDALTVCNAGAAKLLGISESHLYGLKRTGRFGPAPIRLGRCCRYRVRELEAWVDAGCPSRSRWQAMRQNGGGR
jgi:predicted DNA-binding transcriptional regulator AlpA